MRGWKPISPQKSVRTKTLALLVIFSLLTVFKALDYLSGPDRVVYDYVSSIDGKVLWIKVISETASLPVLSIFVGVLCIWMRRKGMPWSDILRLVASYAFLQILTVILKAALAYPRPEDFGNINVGYGPAGFFGQIDRYSYPSGHAARASFIAAFIKDKLRRRTVAVFMDIYAVLIGITRVLLSVHWTSDVIAGIVLGALVYQLSYHVKRNWADRAARAST